MYQTQPAAILFIIVLLAATGFAQSDNIQKGQLSPARVQEIIKRLAANEDRDRDAWKGYSFKRSVIIQSLGLSGQITGEYHRDSLLGADVRAARSEKLLFFPIPTLSGISFAIEDLEDMTGGDPFALASANVGNYEFNYLGTEHIDEINTFVFDVTPKNAPDVKDTKRRFFAGRIWVDDRDLVIIKTRGRSVPKLREYSFPTVEAYRELIDDKYWFPSYFYSQEELADEHAQPFTIRSRIKYMDYRSK